MLTFVVIPCLDEIDLITDAIASLGFFGDGVRPPDSHLIVVDNGSTDGTLNLLARIREASDMPIHLVSEPVRGFVPPRHRGVLEAHGVAQSLCVAERDVLILQADADTIYRDEYIATMQQAAVGNEGVLLEGSTKPPTDFALAHASYLAAQRLVDDYTDQLDADDEEEVVVDDKVCGFRMSDYFAWGGLFEEWTDAGDAIHAETTRLYIRARLLHGARKIRVNPAGAVPSRRKIIQNPWLQYATVGFPREASWVSQREAKVGEARGVDAFSLAVLEGRETEAVYLRQAHQLALFRYLPAIIAQAGSEEPCPGMPFDVVATLRSLPVRSRDQMSQEPGQILLDLFDLISTRPDLFART